MKFTLVLTGLLFFLQTYPGLCVACLTGGCGVDGNTQLVSEEMSCHGDNAVNACSTPARDRESQTDEASPDTCPHCTTLTACPSNAQKNIVPASSGHFSPESILLASSVPNTVGDSFDSQRVFWRFLPEPNARSNPIYILNTAFLI